jgi:peptidoglycan/xylan/chitin deacetylase (PgdA/CDA1 family)
MHRYFIKTPWIVKKIFNAYTWNFPQDEKAVYLTFDDGPHPYITPWVLEELKKHEAYATFFCIGKNVEENKETYESILNQGHATGNHTFQHLNGWKTNDETYVQDVIKASRLIHSNLFRPPYGKIKVKQARYITDAFKNKINIIMWDTLSGDFDKNYSAEQCIRNVIEHVENGSIIVFHDSEKAYPNLKQTLPVVLEYLSKEGYKLKKIEYTPV